MKKLILVFVVLLATFVTSAPPAKAAGWRRIAKLQASASSLSLGTIMAGISSTQTLVIKNTGNASASISQISTGNAAFSVSGITLPATVAAGGSLTLTVSFTPATAGSYLGTLALQSNATNPTLSVGLSGTAVAAAPVVSLSPTSLTFASQTVATTSAAQSVTLSNMGTGSLSLSGIGASGDFAETNNCGSSLAASSSCTISVTFTPTATGTRTGAISFTDNGASSPQQISLSGTAAAASSATLQASASSLSLGSITAGTSSSQTLVIKNTGNASATISQINTGNTAFGVTGVTLPATIAAGASLTLTVSFTPATSGSYTAALAIQSNATNSTLSVGLSGTAVAAVEHQVTLSWTETSSSVMGYNVYRSTQSGTNYTEINPSLNAGQSFTDATVSAGQTYYYVVTAVNESDIESAYSAQVSAVVPTP